MKVREFKWEDLVEDNEGVKVNFNKDGKAILNFANETDTSSTGIDSVQPTIILKDILKFAQEKSYFIEAVQQSNAGIVNKAATVKIPIATSNESFTEYTTEATARTWTEIENISTVSFNYALKKYGCTISKDVVATSAADIIKFARDQIIYDVSLKMDNAIAQALADATPAASLYGGDATNTNSLADGDILTTDLIANAVKELREEGWASEPDKPFILFIAPPQEQALLKDSQFVNASEYGSNIVVLNGEIGKYLGCRVISTTRTETDTDAGGTWGCTAGHRCMLVKAKTCGALVWFEKPHLDGEYEKNEARTNIYLDTSYATDSLQDKAIVHIDVSDA